jgi:hypothetical protein
LVAGGEGGIRGIGGVRADHDPAAAAGDPIVDLVERLGLGWGDAHWVDVAMRLDRPLLTADLRLARGVPDEIAIVVYLGDDQVA